MCIQTQNKPAQEASF